MVGQGRTQSSSRRAQHGVAGQLRAALGASIFVLVAILGVAFYVPYELNRTSDERYVENVIPLNRAAQDLVSQVASGEAAAADYLLTRDGASYDRYGAAFGAASRNLTTLDAMASDDPALQSLVRNATAQIADLQGVLERRLGGTPSPGAARATPEPASVAAAFRRLRTTTEAMLAQTNTLVAAAQERQDRTYRELLVTLAVLGSLGLAIGAAVFVYTPRRVGELYAAERRARR
ncbi:MAG: CHASE3 domain-containing protein, partial [Thermoleophilia bacterium]|nr:CHASE3 domain-containing protein [Thermoleophilia bacterium]